MEKYTKWTIEQETFLKNYYGVLATKEIAGKINKTIGSVQAKAARLGLKSSRNRLKTNEEYEDLLFNKEIDFLVIEPYLGSQIPILHECINGHRTKIMPNSILSGQGCSTCAKIARTKTHTQYISESPFEVLDSYVNSETPIRHKCPKGHVWKASPNSILKGRGCPSCAQRGFDSNKPAILYYIKITKDNLTYYKIGITNSTVKDRFRNDRDKEIVVLNQESYSLGSEAKKKESSLLKMYKVHRQHVPEFLNSGGNTELFEFDVLGLDYNDNI